MSLLYAFTRLLLRRLSRLGFAIFGYFFRYRAVFGGAYYEAALFAFTKI